MTTALTKAFAGSQRSLIACKASVSQVSRELMAGGPTGLALGYRPDLLQAPEQYLHFKGWVYASIRPIAQKIAGQPIHVGHKVSTRKLNVKNFQPTDVKPYESHPLIDLLSDPNDLQVAWSLIYVTLCSLELTGRQLWWAPERKQILPIPTSWIRGTVGSTRITSFKVQPNHSGETFDLPADECVYFTYPACNGDPHACHSPLQAIINAVIADEAIQTSQVASFRQGINPSVMLIVGKSAEGYRPRLSGAQQRQIISSIKKRYAGAYHHGEPLIIDGLIEDAKKLSLMPSEMDWLNSSKLTKERVMQGFGVNPIIAGQIEGANRASSIEAERHFIEYTVNPKIELLSQTLTEWFQWMFNDDQLVVWIEPAVVRDEITQTQWAALLARYSAITGDELRELSPFDLELGKFPNPVTPAGRMDSQDAELLGKLVDDSNKQFKRWTFEFPERVDRHADNIVNNASTNGDTFQWD